MFFPIVWLLGGPFPQFVQLSISLSQGSCITSLIKIRPKLREDVENVNFPYITLYMTMLTLTPKCATCFSTDPLDLYNLHLQRS